MSGLSDAHRRMLFEESGISPEIVAERGVRSVSGGRGELPAVFSWRQKRRGAGVLFTVHRPGGETSHVFRPDEPDPENPGHKYEQPCKNLGGSGNVLDVHPRMRSLLEEPSVPLWWVEGIKKADALTSRGAVAVGISGVWNWLSEGEPISDMWEIPVEGRRVYVCFDSDMLRNPGVQEAAERLAEHLQRRGAEVLIAYLPDQPDGSKTGADDFLASGGTLEELIALARPFDPSGADLQREKLSRSERLRRALDFLQRREEELPAKSQRDCSRRAAWRALVGRAEQRGKLVEDGVEIAGLSARRGAELAAMSQPTFSKCVAGLEADGFLRRGERETKEQATPYVLLVGPLGGVLRYHYGGPGSAGERGQGESHRGDNAIPPLPEMRWSSPGRKPRRGLVKDTRRVRQGHSLTAEVPSKRRPGKKRFEIVRYVTANGGRATREELLERFGGPHTTWRDFKKQILADLLGARRAYQGQHLSVGPPVVALDDAGIHLVEGWREALEEHRNIGQEPEAADEQQRRHLAQSIAYRKRREMPADPAPTEEEMDAEREARSARPDPRRRVEALVGQGMAREIAAREVRRADGFLGDLSPVDLDDTPPGPPEEHPLDCACLGCSATMPTYARPSLRGAAGEGGLEPLRQPGQAGKERHWWRSP